MSQPNEDAINPVAEAYRQEFIPYRGSNFHGVEPPDQADEGNEVATVDVVYEEPETPPDPVPVTIVTNPAPLTRVVWQAGRWRVGTSPVLLVNRHDRRKGLTVRNMGGGRLYLSPDSTVSPWTGHPVETGAEVTLESTDAVWAVGETVAAVSRTIVAVPRQTLAGNTIVVGPDFDTTDVDSLVLMLRVYAITGTTAPASINGLLYPIIDGQPMAGSDVAVSTSVVAPGGAITKTYAPFTDSIRPRILTSGASADANTDVDLVAILKGKDSPSVGDGNVDVQVVTEREVTL